MHYLAKEGKIPKIKQLNKMATQKNNRNLVIGIYIDSFSSPEILFKTLYFLKINTNIEYKVILLLNHITPEMNKEIRNTLNYRIIDINNQLGRTGLFNSLIETGADYYLYVECGMLVGPQAIEQMLDLMEKDPLIGIIGPSSNNCWNQQSIYTDNEPKDVAFQDRTEKTKQEKQFNYQELDSLVESFLLVRKDVIEKIGYADEKYANGFYWEADYCVRIKKAGFKIVWSKNIYVHNLLKVTDKGRIGTSRINSAYFKEKFCSKRNSTLPQNCRNGCNGFLCDNFAIDGNYTLKITERADNQKHPLVSCIMPTKNRAQLIPQAVKYFHLQDYPNKELIIVYDTINDLPENMETEKNVFLFVAKDGYSIGKKRNMACKNASGEIIIHWDDDDWYSKDRISRQVRPILENNCDITALNNSLYYVPSENEFWECSEELSKKMLVENVHGGTLAYRKLFWNENNKYPDTSLREDADFMLNIIRLGAKLLPIDGRDLFIYLRHSNNSWAFKTGGFIDPDGWKKVNEPKCISEDIGYYQTIFLKAGNEPKAPKSFDLPKVTCIMPTANRRKFARRAITYFQNQLYQSKELIIIDDGEDRIEDLIPNEITGIKYIHIEKKASIGEKRNMACKMANGEIIIHWDDDDWVSPNWIQFQVDSLLKENADVTGLDRPFFFQPKTFSFWQYNYPKTEKTWVHGGTLCYTKRFWERNPFKAINIGEDVQFIWSNCPKKIIPHNGINHYVGFIHDKNASPKYTGDKRWKSVSIEFVKKCIGGEEHVKDGCNHKL